MIVLSFVLQHLASGEISACIRILFLELSTSHSENELSFVRLSSAIILDSLPQLMPVLICEHN